VTPSFGWSLDVNGRRRLSVVLPIVVLTTAFAASGVQAAGYDPASDVNSMASTTDYTGAQAWWAAGYTGRGVDVAIIDSGVSPVDGLNTPGKVIYGPDLSLESQAPNLTNLDTFGHGTFMAGLIAGRDADLTAPYEQAPASAYRGMAPDARIVSIKVATADGGTDVSQVIAAIDWVVQHRNDDGMNIRVLNLSYGTNSSQWYGVDPLAYAA
jgi:serine protease AprX